MTKTRKAIPDVERGLRLGSTIGSALGFVAWLFVGAVPGTVYGGYMGLMMAGLLFGTPVEASIASKVLVGGGILLGVVASLYLFLVLSALAGAAVAFVPLVWRLHASGALPARGEGKPVPSPAKAQPAGN